LENRGFWSLKGRFRLEKGRCKETGARPSRIGIVERAWSSAASPHGRAGADHGGGNIGTPRKRLDRTDVLTAPRVAGLHVMKEREASDPIATRSFGANGTMTEAHRFMDFVRKLAILG